MLLKLSFKGKEDAFGKTIEESANAVMVLKH
jgi:hypothetical protein